MLFGAGNVSHWPVSGRHADSKQGLVGCAQATWLSTWHWPAMQMEAALHGLLSSQGMPSAKAVGVHRPVDSSHSSGWHALPSGQVTMVPAVQTPPVQVSECVHS